MILIGDVLFFRKTDSLISRIIANITKSEFTHVGLIVDFDDSTNTVTIIESDRFVNTRIRKLKLIDGMHTIYSTGELTEQQIKYILKFAYGCIGRKYDYILTIGIFLSLIFKGKRQYFNSSNKLICSELIDLTYYKSGVKRKNSINIGNITPQELLEVYELKEVRKEV